MDVGLPRRDQDLPDPIKNPYALWLRDASEVAYDQVHRNSGQAVRRQKHLYDRCAVRRLFAVGDWTMRYYPPAKKCKLDSPWVGPYLVVSLVGWAVRIQLQPDSPILLVHCQDVKKIPHPSGLVPWIAVALPGSSPAPPLLGASTVCHSTRNSGSSVTGPPVDQTLLSGGTGVHAPGVPGSMLNNPEGSVVSSGNWDSVDTFLPQEVLLVDTTNSLHPFFVHRLDVGPLRLMSIAHAFNYRVTVLRDGVKTAAWVGRSRKAAGRILQDIGLHWGHQVVVMFQILCALALEVPSVLDLGNMHGLSPNVSLRTAKERMFMTCRWLPMSGIPPP